MFSDMVLDLMTEAVVYVPVVIRASAIALLFLFGWLINVKGFEAYGLPFRKVLDLRKSEASQESIVEALRVLTVVLLASFAAYEVCRRFDWELGQSVTLVSFWLILTALGAFSRMTLFKEMRHFLRERAVNLVHGDVVFADVLVADVLTSMSKLLADMQIVVCAVLAIFSEYPDVIAASCIRSWVGPALASLPYAIRAVQCLLVYQSSGNTAQLINFGKYVSSFPVIWLSAIHHQVAPVEGVVMDAHDQHMQVLWLYAVTINTLYSFLWDVLMDWGLGFPSSPASYTLLRDDLRFGGPLPYYFAIVMDLALRLCWSLKLSSHLQRHATGQAFVFLFEILEVFRRFLWNFFRVEWECIKQNCPSELRARTPSDGHTRDRDRGIISP
eukprot:m.191913 g.191913  ORF g.191913 m.191913 type:complete len:385 (+) comp17577_c0_seq2:363-1517(+)